MSQKTGTSPRKEDNITTSLNCNMANLDTGTSLPPFPKEGVSLLLLQRIRDVSHNEWTTTDISQNLIKPWTEAKLCSFEELMFQEHQINAHPVLNLTYDQCFGPSAKIFVSHAWKYGFVEFVDCIESYFQDQNELTDLKELIVPDTLQKISENETVFLWIDLFVNNQWKASSLPYEWWSGTFLSAVGDIGHTMLVLSPWDAPIPLTRAWCLWEILSTIKTNSKLTIQLSRSQRSLFQSKLRTDFEYIKTALCKIDVAKSEAFHVKDRDMIFEAVEKFEAGFRGVNNQIMNKVRDWVADSARHMLTQRNEGGLLADPDSLLPTVIIGGGGGNDIACTTTVSSDTSAAAKSNKPKRNQSHHSPRPNHPNASNSNSNSKEGVSNGLKLSEDDKTKVNELHDQNRVGLLLRQQGQLAEAENIYRRVVEGFERIEGADGLDTLMVVNNLAILMRDRGKYDEAEAMFQRVLKAYEHKLGCDDGRTLGVLHNLAVLLDKIGKKQSLVKSNELFKRCLEGMEKLYGKNDPQTLDTLNAYANLLSKQEKYEKCKVMYNRVLTSLETRLGPDHEDTLRVVQCLGKCLMDSGKCDEAEPMFQRVLIGYERLLGLEHLHTLNVMNCIAVVFAHQEKFIEAEEMYLRIIETYKKVVGLDHADAVRAKENLAKLKLRAANKTKAKAREESQGGVAASASDGGRGARAGRGGRKGFTQQHHVTALTSLMQDYDNLN